MPQKALDSVFLYQSQNALQDNLLDCLLWFAKHFHKSTSAKAFTAGLPLVNNKLTPALFIRAAERAHLAATLCKKETLEQLPKSCFPCVILLNDNKACILLKIDKKNKAQILDPQLGMSVIELKLSNLKKSYIGNYFVIKPAYEFSKHADTLASPQKKNWFWSALQKVWPLYTEVLVASFLINLFALAVPLFSMNVYDRVVPNQAVETLWVLALGILFVFAFDFVMRLLRSYFIDLAGRRVDQKISAQVFEQILDIKMQARPNSVGAMANVIQSFESFRDFITSTTITVLIDLPFVLLFILIIASIGGTIALLPLLVIPTVILLGWLIQIPLTSLTKESYKHSGEKQATLIEALHNIETIKSIGAETTIQRRWEQVTHLSSSLSVKLRFFTNFNIYFSLIAQQFAYVSVIIWGVYKIAQGNLTMGGLIACSLLTSRALAPISQVAALLTRYYQSRQSLTSLDRIMQLPVERETGKTTLHYPQLNGSIEFQQVNFQYEPQGVSLLKNVSFKIQPGEKVAIIGRIGSCKTTIAKLLLNLLQPTQGKILFDNIEQHQIDVADLRHNIGYVPQDVMLMQGSVRDNIVLGAPYVEDEVILNAITLSGVNEFIQNNPKGLDLSVGEGGRNLSGGQRQTIAIARAVLLDPPILIFDEPSNALDDKTEMQLKQKLQYYIENKTFVLITHKSSMLTLVNRIIVMDGGKVIADGPKEHILAALKNGQVKTRSELRSDI